MLRKGSPALREKRTGMPETKHELLQRRGVKMLKEKLPKRDVKTSRRKTFVTKNHLRLEVLELLRTLRSVSDLPTALKVAHLALEVEKLLEDVKVNGEDK